MPGNAANAMFTFGRGYGFLRGVMVANKIAFFDVPPQTWQNTLKLKTEKTRRMTKAQRKTSYLEKAKQWYPNASVKRDTADALLIAHYAYVGGK